MESFYVLNLTEKYDDGEMTDLTRNNIFLVRNIPEDIQVSFPMGNTFLIKIEVNLF